MLTVTVDRKIIVPFEFINIAKSYISSTINLYKKNL